MAFVTKCDICGEIYKTSSDPQSSRFNLDGPFVTDLENRHIDCCPECTKKLQNFIGVLKTGYNYCIYMDEAELLETKE